MESFDHHLSRRKFIGLVGAGTAALFLKAPNLGADEMGEGKLEQWKKTLGSTAPRVYLSDKHTDARMHLGGIGTGNIEIGADGQLTNWQLFNTLRDGYVPFYFCVKVGEVARLLQTSGGPDWPRIQRIEMTGEYPVASLKFEDEQLPVRLQLEAFSPFAPLDAKISSLPLALFRFRINNPTAKAQTVSLAAMTMNPVGYAAIGKIEGNSHPSFIANVTEPFREGDAAGLFLRAERGYDPSLDKSVRLYVLRDAFVVPPDPDAGNTNYAYVAPWELSIPPLDRPENLKVAIIEPEQFSAATMPAGEQALIWLEDAPAGFAPELIAEIKKAVEQGAILVFSGGEMPLLNAFGTATGGKPINQLELRPDIVFEDFEAGYEKWTIDGNAFGREPAHGTLPHQQRVSGFKGNGLVNSFVNGDDARGKLTSIPFKIERNFIQFLIGGGHFPTTQMRLVVNGKVERTASGEDNERLKPAAWHVADFAGQEAHIEIVDDQAGGWGHINVDQIVFSDWPGNREVLAMLDELLPVRFSGVKTMQATGDAPKPVTFAGQWLYSDTVQSTASNGLTQFVRPFGNGKVVLLAGRVLDPARTYSAAVRQEAYATLCALAGAHYAKTIGQSAKEPGFGTLALASLGGQITGATDFENWDETWRQFAKEGQLQSFQTVQASQPSSPGRTHNCALANVVTVPAGGEVEVPFLLAWHYPNKYSQAGAWMGCHYSTQWNDARAVLREAAKNYRELAARTVRFRSTFYSGTLPYWLLDCVTANSAIIRHVGVVFQIANSDIYGWEGSNGSCEPTCTHVWGYEQALAHLFPDLEKSMRRIDYFHQQNADGGINNRTEVPSPMHPTGEQPFTDGHASCILKAYREGLNSTDESFFKGYWPYVKRAVEYLIARDASAAGGQAAGVLQDVQWNTYDEALHGVTTFISGYYLAALRAAEEWAVRVGDQADAERYHRIFERGQKRLIELCWNGEYFQQHLPDYQTRSGEVGPGCMSDQLLGQWWAHQLGLGYLLPPDMVRGSLRSIFKYNWKADLTNWRQLPRQFAGPADKGLIVCTWPKGGRPAAALNYADELWTGMEYQVAAHMIYEGMVEAGLMIAKAARDRYDGVPRAPIGRNPWCEIECGGHYTRAMSSWSLLLASSGYRYDGPRGILEFGPRYNGGDFKCFFTAAAGWGIAAQRVAGGKQNVSFSIHEGSMQVATLRLRIAAGLKAAQGEVVLDKKRIEIEFSVIGEVAEIRLGNEGVLLDKEHELEINLT